MDASQKFLTLIIPKSWHFTVLIEAHNKLGQQGVNRTYHIIKWQLNYIANCTLCKRGKAKMQMYPLQMMDIPDQPFDKIAIDSITDLNVSILGNQHILTIIVHFTGYQLSSNSTPYHRWNNLLPHFQERPNLSLHQLLESMQHFLNDPDSGHLNLEVHHLALAIAKKLLDKNWFRNALKTTTPPASDFQLGDRVYFKNKQPGKWDLKWRAGYRTVHIECNGHHLYIENQATGNTQSCNVKDFVHEPPANLWNVVTKFGRAGKFFNHSMNLPTITLHDTLKKSLQQLHL